MSRRLASLCLALVIPAGSLTLGLASCSTSESAPSGDGASGGRVGSGGSGGGAGGAMEGSPCSSNMDCDPTNSYRLICQAPGEFLGCGSCQVVQDRCTTDDQCVLDAGAVAGPQICLAVSSSLSCYYCNAPHLCVSGCRTSDVCGVGQACNPTTHACEHACVAGDGTCPVDSVCSADGFCVTKTCQADGECSVACVKGRCYGERGRCTYPRF